MILKPTHLLPLFLALVFVLLTVSKINGYSLARWHTVLDLSAEEEVLWGGARAERADDWLVDIPFILAQWAHQPKFPKFNGNLGSGHLMMAPSKTPVSNFIFLFRPTTWGFIFGPDVGVAWMWNSLALGLLYAFFLIFMILSGDRFWLSLGAAVALTLSPVFQFWSFFRAEIQIHAALTVVALVNLARARSKSGVFAFALLLCWSIGGLFLDNVYPPFQIIAAYLVFALVVGILFHHRWYYRQWLGLALAAIGVGITGWLFLAEMGDVLGAIQNTVYPGLRRNTGGGLSIVRLMVDTLYAHALQVNWVELGNICEASTGILYFPLLFIYFVVNRRHWDRKQLTVPIALFLFLTLSIVYGCLGFPSWLAKITFFSRSLHQRLSTGIAIADLCLLVWFLSHPAPGLPAKRRGLALLTWSVVLIGLAFLLKQEAPSTSSWRLVLVVLGQIGMGFLFFSPPKQRYFVPILILVSFLLTYRFNPIARGGTKFIYENELSRAITELSKSHPQSYWLVLQGEEEEAELTRAVGNLFRMLGVKSYCGYFNYPDPFLFHTLDPQGAGAYLYNRTAGINWSYSDNPYGLFRVINEGNIEIRIDPKSPKLAELGVRYIVNAGKPNPLLEGSGKFLRKATFRRVQIYEIR